MTHSLCNCGASLRGWRGVLVLLCFSPGAPRMEYHEIRKSQEKSCGGDFLGPRRHSRLFIVTGLQ